MFFKGSRYEKVETAEHTGRDGRTVLYKKVRFIPETPARLGHRVQQGERLDHVAQRYYKDPERFWRVADANLALQPARLTAEPGRTLLIPPVED